MLFCCSPAPQAGHVPGWNLPWRQVQWDCCFLILCLRLLPEGRVGLPGYGFSLGLVLTFLTVGKICAKTADTKLCLAISCLKQTDQEKPVGKCNCFLNRLQGTESQVTVIESSILQLWEAYQRREGITDMGDCRTCFCRRLSRFRFGGLFLLLKRSEKNQGGKRPFLLMFLRRFVQWSDKLSIRLMLQWCASAGLAICQWTLILSSPRTPRWWDRLKKFILSIYF